MDVIIWTLGDVKGNPFLILIIKDTGYSGKVFVNYSLEYSNVTNTLPLLFIICRFYAPLSSIICSLIKFLTLVSLKISRMLSKSCL